MILFQYPSDHPGDKQGQRPQKVYLSDLQNYCSNFTVSAGKAAICNESQTIQTVSSTSNGALIRYIATLSKCEVAALHLNGRKRPVIAEIAKRTDRTFANQFTLARIQAYYYRYLDGYQHCCSGEFPR
jgi:hypothetical protein